MKNLVLCFAIVLSFMFVSVADARCHNGVCPVAKVVGAPVVAVQVGKNVVVDTVKVGKTVVKQSVLVTKKVVKAPVVIVDKVRPVRRVLVKTLCR